MTFFAKFGMVMQVGPLSVPTIEISKNLKIQDDSGRHHDKSKNLHISATIGPIATKFSTLAQFDPPDHSHSCNVDAAYLCNHEFLDKFPTV